MANAVFDPAETESERTVIISEREGSENNYFYRLQEEVQAAAYLAHSYRHPVIGWKTDLSTMTRDDLYRHYRTYYTPNNAVAVVTGDFDADDMLARLQHYFGTLAPGPQSRHVAHARTGAAGRAPRRRCAARTPPPTSCRLFTPRRPAHAGFLPPDRDGCRARRRQGHGHLRRQRQQPQQPALPGPGRTRTGRRRGSSYRPDHRSGPLHHQRHAGARRRPTQQVEEAIWHEIERIQARRRHSSRESRKAIKQTKAQFAYSSESVTYEAYWLGFSEVVASLDWLDTWVEQLSAVTPADVQRVAQRYFPATDRRSAGMCREGNGCCQ